MLMLKVYFFASFDFQFINNPAYINDRGAGTYFCK